MRFNNFANNREADTRALVFVIELFGTSRTGAAARVLGMPIPLSSTQIRANSIFRFGHKRTVGCAPGGHELHALPSRLEKHCVSNDSLRARREDFRRSGCQASLA